MKQTNLNRILKSEVSVARLPRKIQLQENIAVATYNLTPTIRNKILNYKETAEAIILDDGISCSASLEKWNCERSAFCDEHYAQITAGNLRLITNTRLRSLLSEGPNYRELNTIDYSKCKIAIDSSIKNCIEKFNTKYR